MGKSGEIGTQKANYKKVLPNFEMISTSKIREILLHIIKELFYSSLLSFLTFRISHCNITS